MKGQESVYLPHFTIGINAFDAFRDVIGRYGNKIAAVHGEKAWNAAGRYVTQAVEKAGMTTTGEILYGHEATWSNVERLVADQRVRQSDVLLAVGGGKCVDTVKLAADLLEAGKQEFLEKGFQGASMRGIASRLSVTTGALYRYYTDKESLFDVLVEEPARVLEERYRAIQRNFADQPVKDQVQTLPEVSDEGHSWMVEYIYDHFDAFKLIVCCSAGTRYEHYLDVLTEIEVNSSIVLMEKMKEAGYQPEELDENLIHMVASSMFNGMFETVRHDMPREKAISYMNSLREFYSAGWFRLLGISGS